MVVASCKEGMVDGDEDCPSAVTTRIGGCPVETSRRCSAPPVGDRPRDASGSPQAVVGQPLFQAPLCGLTTGLKMSDGGGQRHTTGKRTDDSHVSWCLRCGSSAPSVAAPSRWMLRAANCPATIQPTARRPSQGLFCGNCCWPAMLSAATACPATVGGWPMAGRRAAAAPCRDKVVHRQRAVAPPTIEVAAEQPPTIAAATPSAFHRLRICSREPGESPPLLP
jgi:hypothetical protein